MLNTEEMLFILAPKIESYFSLTDLTNFRHTCFVPVQEIYSELHRAMKAWEERNSEIISFNDEFEPQIVEYSTDTTNKWTDLEDSISDKEKFPHLVKECYRTSHMYKAIGRFLGSKEFYSFKTLILKRNKTLLDLRRDMDSGSEDKGKNE